MICSVWWKLPELEPPRSKGSAWDDGAPKSSSSSSLGVGAAEAEANIESRSARPVEPEVGSEGRVTACS